MVKAGEAEKLAYLAETHEKRLVHELEKLNIKYTLGIINKETYEYTLTHLLRGRSVQDWMNYYDNYKGQCAKIIEEENHDNWFRNFMLILLVLAILIPLSLQYTGFAISSGQENAIFVGRTVSTGAYLSIDGVAQAIPGNLEFINGEYVYKINYLKVPSSAKHIEIIDNGNLVFVKNL
ncbi:MAG: hypothetical protein PHD81_01860 [Candidatus Nanoarchaeia archaeon]|nr:hypothetical protein [Candidatus Nanoarchaeia archaeon]MDD5587834.1 hypothetical protein [Candidatus Nanoarchaeia archaeon]